MTNFEKSPLWDSIFESDSFKDININTFKDGGANSRITQYSYKTHGLLFFKNILFQMAEKLGSNNISILSSIPNRHVGGGVSILYGNIELDLDYLLALEEVLFLRQKLKSIKSVLEIGAGYGRTCHSILSLFPNIEKYEIIDFPQMLELSSSYLKTVAEDVNFSKIKFIPVGGIIERNYDLIINIDSMQEMSTKTAQDYLEFVNRCGSSFYCKNTVGKFNPELCGWKKTEGSELAMNSGIVRDVINIFCPNELKKAQENFMCKFMPGENWMIEKHDQTLPWSHYYQALFVKNA